MADKDSWAEKFLNDFKDEIIPLDVWNAENNPNLINKKNMIAEIEANLPRALNKPYWERKLKQLKAEIEGQDDDL